MKILIATAFFPPEPIVESQMAYDIASKLALKHEVTVLRPKPSRPVGYKFEKEKTDYPFKVVELDTYIYTQSKVIGRTIESYDQGKKVAKYIKAHRHEIDVVYANILPFWGEYVLAKTMHKLRIPFITHVQDVFPEPLVRRVPLIGNLLFKIVLPIDKYILKTADRVLVIGPKIGDYLIRTRKVTGDNFRVIYNWQDESRFADIHPEDRESPLFTFMFCGSLSTGANLEYIADCFIKANNENARFVFAGSGNLLEPLKAKATENPQVHFDFIPAPSSEVGKIQSQADVLVMPLRKEVALRCFPSKFPAYLFSHKPILACVESNSDVGDCVKKASCGWVVEPEDEKTLVNMFKSIPEYNKEALKEMGQNAYEFSQQNLTREVNLNNIVSIIESVKN